jgi:lysyl-tRNA synthetase class 1
MTMNEHWDRWREAGVHAKAWPFEEARRILNRIQRKTPQKGFVLLETGYGPSGLPHIGTFGEVARTCMVRHAFQVLSDIPTRLYAFSDDMDGLRKVPDNVPNQEMLTAHLGKPLTQIPDPFGKYESFGHHNNAMLCQFLDSFKFDYEFQSSTDWYKSGRFDETLKLVLENYDDVIGVILPTLGKERQATYSPFLPICPTTGVVLQVPIISRDIEAATITYLDPKTGVPVEVPITGGHCKLQWKADWGMRWRAFDVDYEMSGKDLIDSVRLSSQITQTLGGRPPECLTYEHFLDEQGQKISKSKGNGLTIDDWLKYAPWESLSYYMYQSPRKAKRLFFDVIPRNVDEYLSWVAKYPIQPQDQQLENPTWHVHSSHPPVLESTLSFGILLNLASVCNAEDASILWGFVSRYQPDVTPESAPFLARLIDHAIHYYHDFILPHKTYRIATDLDQSALLDLRDRLKAIPADTSAEDLQTLIFEVGKSHPYPELRAWFTTLYEVLLGQSEGPRMGSFIALYGIAETIELIDEKVSEATNLEIERLTK